MFLRSGKIFLILYCSIAYWNSDLRAEFAKWANYKVSRGDSLYQVARKFKVSIQDIYKLNPRKRKNPSLYTGETLRIPREYSHAEQPTAKLKSYFQYPLERKIPIKTRYSSVSYAPHKGVAFQESKQPLTVLASRGGRVSAIDYMDGYGNYIILQHYGGYYSIYANIGKILVNEGQKIGKGQKLGLTEENRGFYFQINLRDKPLDPLPYII